MKTPIRELIDTLKEMQGTMNSYSLQDAIEVAESMLQKERGVIIDTYNDGVDESGTIFGGREYYESVFNEE